MTERRPQLTGSRPFGLNWLINASLLSCPTYQSAALAHEGSHYHTPSFPSRSGTFAEQTYESSHPCSRQIVRIIVSTATRGDIILELKYLMALLQTIDIWFRVIYLCTNALLDPSDGAMYKRITRSK